MAKKIVLKPFLNKSNGQISLHPRKKELSKKVLNEIKLGKMMKIEIKEFI